MSDIPTISLGDDNHNIQDEWYFDDGNNIIESEKVIVNMQHVTDSQERPTLDKDENQHDNTVQQ